MTGGDVMGLLGRQKIYTDVEKIDKNNVVDVLQKAYAKHRQNVLDIQYLIDYERGEQPLKRQKTVRADIDIKVNSSLPNYIKNAKHRQNVLDIQYLIDYERGEQPLKRQKTVRADIDIKVNSSLPNYIKKFKKGYNWGSPILLVQRGNKEIHNTDSNTDDSGISGLNEILKNGENISFKDQQMAEFIEICGIGHRMIEPKTFPKE